MGRRRLDLRTERGDLVRTVLKPLASLRLTVWLFAAAMVLIFAGTLAQTGHGVWRVVDSYFRSAIAWIDLGVFVPGGGR